MRESEGVVVKAAVKKVEGGTPTPVQNPLKVSETEYPGAWDRIQHEQETYLSWKTVRFAWSAPEDGTHPVAMIDIIRPRDRRSAVLTIPRYDVGSDRARRNAEDHVVDACEQLVVDNALKRCHSKMASAIGFVLPCRKEDDNDVFWRLHKTVFASMPPIIVSDEMVVQLTKLASTAIHDGKLHHEETPSSDEDLTPDFKSVYGTSDASLSQCMRYSSTRIIRYVFPDVDLNAFPKTDVPPKGKRRRAFNAPLH